ncbi:MAG: hypothetical protein HY286_15625 [Planctomycetes bacterium]|nr:hypothetical protein [Planctomycetota bacterium]
MRNVNARSRNICGFIIIFGGIACAYHPSVAELNTMNRSDALHRCEQALRTRFARIDYRNAERGCLSTEARLESADPVVRESAYLVLTPGAHGWAAEITVLREQLDADRAAIANPGARWVSMGRDLEMESFLVETIENWLAHPAPVFGTVESSGGGTASSQPTIDR